MTCNKNLNFIEDKQNSDTNLPIKESVLLIVEFILASFLRCRLAV